MTTEPESTLAKRLAATLFSDAMMVGGLTILGYLTAYSIESGRALALGIPGGLVSVSLEEILTSLTILLLLLAIGSGGELLVYQIIPSRIRSSVLIRPFAHIVVVFLVASLLGFFLNPIFYGLLLVALLLLIGFLSNPFYERTGGSYIERLEKSVQKHNEIKREIGEPSWLSRRLGNAPFFVVFVFVVAISAGYALGLNDVRFASYYFVSATNPDEVLVARYSEILVFRRKSSPTIIIRVIGKDAIPPLVEKRTGSMAIKPAL